MFTALSLLFIWWGGGSTCVWVDRFPQLFPACLPVSALPVLGLQAYFAELSFSTLDGGALNSDAQACTGRAFY